MSWFPDSTYRSSKGTSQFVTVKLRAFTAPDVGVEVVTPIQIIASAFELVVPSLHHICVIEHGTTIGARIKQGAIKGASVVG